ncbi:MAG: efflux RND transporter periplasmic adaptor subunit [Gammaproteobacteria bacterium]|nr:efflux RND transporter periplasmic adaptor subunit [Gammaproteobacteria bacterium]
MCPAPTHRVTPGPYGIRVAARVGVRVCIGLLVAAALLSGCSGNANDNTSAESAPRSSPVAAVELAPRDLTRRVDLVATVQPHVTVRIPSRMSGYLDAVLVEEGDRVEEGGVLARFDTAEQAAEAARARAEARFARLELDNMRRLRQTNAVSQNELDRAEMAVEVAEAARQVWETRLAFGVVRAPHAGVITARHVESGESVDAQDVLFELAVLERLVLRPLVSERDVVHLQVGETARVRIDALPDLDLEARINRVFPAADPLSRLLPVELELPPEATQLGVQPGFLARVRLQVDPRPGVLAVPAAAIGEDAELRYVYVIADNQLERRDVKPGVTRGQWTEITEGLQSGELVLASNPIDMREGERVRIVGWRE